MKSFIPLITALALTCAAMRAGEAKEAASAAYFNKGKLAIVSSSHQDTAWMDSPAACRDFRIEHNIMPAMEMMRKNRDYTFCMECALHLQEFIEAHPEMRDEVTKYMKEGRLEFGATYNQPYESWLSGEELVREVYYGRRWILKNFPACDMKVAFNPDPPARSWQMQQILAKSGVPYMFISRFHEGLWRWQSPDGSHVLMYTPGQYGNHHALLSGPTERSTRFIYLKLKEQGSYYQKRGIPAAYALINSSDFSKPRDFGPLIQAWNAQKPGQTDGIAVPTMGYSSIRGFFETVDKRVARFDTVNGERPDVWVYITGPTHLALTYAKREAARLLPAAETFTTFASLLNGNFNDWPSKALSDAWQDEIYADHGLGGKNGHITDEVFLRKAVHARDTGKALLDKALGTIASDVKTDRSKGAPLTVFNDLSWERSDIVAMDLPEGVKEDAKVVDPDGRAVPSQVTLLESPEEINVASAAQGSKVSASSEFNQNFPAAKAIDGKWAVSDPSPEVGPADKWASAAGTGPHWLAIDFGKARNISRIVVHHQGVLGKLTEESVNNTSDFQLQSSDSASGPWQDLVAPVQGNTASLTTHSFAPKSFRYLRLNITKPTQTSDAVARIFEVEAFEKATPKPKLLIAADKIPSLGYKTFYLQASEAKADDAAKPNMDGAENSFYRLRLAPGGIQSVFDKQQNRELLDPTKFLGGEVFTMNSYAPGMPDAGEQGAVVQPIMDGSFDRVATHKPQWTLAESGPLRSVWQLEQPLADTTVRQRVILWNHIKRIDCEVDLKGFNGKLWREFRMALPLAMDKPQISYEVPFGVVTINKDEIPMSGGHAYANVTYSQMCRDIRPRMVQNFVDASDPLGGLTMTSSVGAFDWMDPTVPNPSGTLLQPILLASRKSCHWQGNWYPQAGDHSFRFSITTHTGDWKNGWRNGIAANHPLHPVVGAQARPHASLPPEQSLASATSSNAIISTIKKCEDDDSVVARIYDIEGKDSSAMLHFFKPLKSAQKTDMIEMNAKAAATENGVAKIPVGHHAIETIKVRW